MVVVVVVVKGRQAQASKGRRSNSGHRAGDQQRGTRPWRAEGEQSSAQRSAGDGETKAGKHVGK